MSLFNNYTIILVFLWIVILVFCIKDILYTKQLQVKDYRLIVMPILIFIGVIIRTIYLTYPYGVFPDESIAGYDAWCIANYGVDQHLASYPVYLQSWGSGQSAVYAYLAAPFVKLFGLSIEVLRLPMAIISSLSLAFLYYVLRKTEQNKSLSFAFIFIIVISPWHIMKSRWALDCNLCPEFVLIGVGFILLGIHYKQASLKQTVYYLVAFAFFVLGAYSYGASWFMLPLFCVILLIYLLAKKYLLRKGAALIIITSLILAIPLILFAYQFVSSKESYTIGPMTIIQLESGRHGSTTLLGTEQPLLRFWTYIVQGVRLLVQGNDKLPWNSISHWWAFSGLFSFWGQFYNVLGIPFIIYAFYRMMKTKRVNTLDTIFIIWLLTLLPMLILVEPNVNHWNLLWFPLLYFMARGIALVADNKQLYAKLIYSFFSCLCICFCFVYFTYYNTYDWRGFVRGQEEPIRFANQLDVDSIYYPSHFIQAHVLYCHPISPYVYSATRDMNDPRGTQVGNFTNNVFYDINHDISFLEPRKAYIVSNGKVNVYESDSIHIKKYDIYSVVWTD